MTVKKFAALASWLLAAALLFTACSTTSGDATAGDGGNGMPSSAEAAAEFGDVVLPPGVEVLGVDVDSGRDTRHRLALRTNAAQLPELLSQFTRQPQVSEIPRTTEVIAGPELSGAPNPLYAQDRITTKGGRTVNREVIVDERSPDEVYVHLSLYTT